MPIALIHPRNRPQSNDRKGRKSRVVFLVQVVGLILCVIGGMSESYRCLGVGSMARFHVVVLMDGW